MPFHTYLDLLPLNRVYFVLWNGNNVLENNISLAVRKLICILIGLIYELMSIIRTSFVFRKTATERRIWPDKSKTVYLIEKTLPWYS